MPRPDKFKSSAAVIGIVLWTFSSLIPQTGYKASLASILQSPTRERKYRFAQFEEWCLMGKIPDTPLNAGQLHRYDLGSIQGQELMLINDAMRYGLRSFYAEDSGRTDEMIQRRDFVPVPGRNQRVSIDRSFMLSRSSSDGRLQPAK